MNKARSSTFNTTKRVTVATALAIGVILPLGGSAQEVEVGDDAREAMKQWVEIRKDIAEERKNWSIGREMLLDRIELVRSEIDSIREKIGEAEEGLGDSKSKREELTAKNEKLKKSMGVLEDVIVEIEKRTAALVVKLPQPLQDRVRLLTEQLPEEGAESTLPLSERYMATLGIMSQVDRFNGDVMVVRESRELGDDVTAEVNVVYLGLGQAYYVSDDEKLAGVGLPSEKGWIWLATNEIAPQVVELIKILSNENPAAFVKIPVTVN